MRIRTARSIAASSMIAAGLLALAGCNAENPDGTKTNLGKAEDKAVETGKKIEAGAEHVGEKIKETAVHATEATGKAIEDTGKKLETSGKDAVEKHVGVKAGEIVEGAGKGLEKAGGKMQDAVKKPE